MVTEASTTAPDQISRHRVVRSVGCLVALALAVPLSAGAAHESLAMGAVLAVVWLLIVGTIGYVIAHLRHRPRTWRHVVFGRAAVITTLLLLFFSAVGATSANAATGDVALKQRIARFVDPGMRHVTTECKNAPIVGRACAASYLGNVSHHAFRIINVFQKPIPARVRFAFARANRLQWQADVRGKGQVTTHWGDGYRALVVDVRGTS